MTVVDPIVIAKIRQSIGRILSGDRVVFYGFTDPKDNSLFISDISIGFEYILPPGGVIRVIEGVSVDTNGFEDEFPIENISPPTVMRDTRVDLWRLADTCVHESVTNTLPVGHDMTQGPRFPILTKGSSSTLRRTIFPPSPLLHDPHLQLASPPDALIVFDNYDYYHYNVDGYNDIGWGCAYRSIHTIVSWLRYNFPHLVDRVPGIVDIQTRLKEIDYAHANMSIGSNAWIGCLEASTVIQDLSGGQISCRILHACNPDDLEKYIMNEVRDNFVNFGAPVMVGAGDYAFVIAGVSAVTRQVLILDPHYIQANGNDPIKKGIVGWKSIRKHFDFKKTNASSGFMNICIPLFPSNR
jgi:hypothetical protein